MFDDRSAIRRVHREGIVLLGGGRALLMQVAHPQVAAGVIEHSNYRADRVARLIRTLRPMLAIAFGTPEQVARAAAGVNALHTNVRGATYSARDPALLAWVLATLIDSSIVTYERFVGMLPSDMLDEYYAQMLDVGALLGMPFSALPPDRLTFTEYVAAMVAEIEVTSDARQIASELFRPIRGTGPAMRLARELTAGLLPPRLRHQYGLTRGPIHATSLDALARVSRGIVPLIPRGLRQPPAFLMP